ncbi:MAG: hypothetical protein LQ341_006338, partial [Variospora aurantia]
MSLSSSDGPAKKERKAAEKEKENAEKAEKARLKVIQLQRKSSEKKLGTTADSSDPAGKENSASVLNRFRQSSKSISKKPKFWTSKENKEKSDASNAEGEETNLMNDKPEKSKNRF